MTPFTWRRWLTIAIAVTATTPAAAMDVRGFETMQQQQFEADASSARTARLALTAYFSGISDLLTVQRVSDGPLRVDDGRAFSCPPARFTFAPVLLQGLAESELSDAAHYARLVPDWKALPAALLVWRGLGKAYPCR